MGVIDWTFDVYEELVVQLKQAHKAPPETMTQLQK